VTPVNSPAVLHLTSLKSWLCHAKTTQKLQSTAPATKIQPYTILKSWPCHAKTTRKLQSTGPASKIQPYDSEVVGPATRKQPESHKVLHMPQKTNLTVTLAEKHKTKYKSQGWKRVKNVKKKYLNAIFHQVFSPDRIAVASLSIPVVVL